MKRLLFALLLAFSLPAFAQIADRRPIEFHDAAEQARFQALVHELRCVMCQNQSLADSDAQIAVDLRHQVLDLMREGRSDDEIREFLVDRYGEFVLYRPQVTASTWLLWFGPALVLVAGGVAVWRIARRRAAAPAVRDDDSGEW